MRDVHYDFFARDPVTHDVKSAGFRNFAPALTGENHMRTMLAAGLSCLTIAYAVATVPTATAATQVGSHFVPGSDCQLSIPTTNTQFRPKATGGRNESATVSNFVICPISSPLTYSNNNDFLGVIRVYSLDGATHSVSCTAVSGYDQAALLYSTKTFDVGSADPSIGHATVWSAADFGGTAGDPIPGSAGFTMTCLLPPQTAIAHAIGAFVYNIGS